MKSNELSRHQGFSEVDAAISNPLFKSLTLLEDKAASGCLVLLFETSTPSLASSLPMVRIQIHTIFLWIQSPSLKNRQR